MAKQTNNTPTLLGKRLSIFEKLNKFKWFKNTTSSLRHQLITLPSDFDGFLEDLLERSDELDNVDILSLDSLERGNHLITPVFKVRSQENNQIFTYEYVSWKSGANPGYKGILLVENEGKVTHFITKTIFKFSQNTEVYDSFGGFIEYKNKKLLNFPTTQEEEIKRQLGISDLVIKEFIDLGHLTPDIGMTNNHSSLFAAIIDGSQATRLNTDTPLKTKGISFKIKIHSIDKLPHFIHQINDSYFLSAIARLLVLGKIKLDK